MTDRAAALAYDDDIPQILAAGRGIMAEKIVEIAEANGITIYRDNDLAEVLTKIGPGEHIPDDLFKAVAGVLSYCYKMNQDFHDKMHSRGVK